MVASRQNKRAGATTKIYGFSVILTLSAEVSGRSHRDLPSPIGQEQTGLRGCHEDFLGRIGTRRLEDPDGSMSLQISQETVMG